MDSYPVFRRERIIGEGNIRRDGLYYTIACQANLPAGQIYRLSLWCKKGNIDLGVLMPNEHGFSLQKKIPAKNISTEDIRFVIADSIYAEYIPIDDANPFSSISKLLQARFERKDGKAYISYFPNNQKE